MRKKWQGLAIKERTVLPLLCRSPARARARFRLGLGV